jgi:hypothetical protein
MIYAGSAAQVQWGSADWMFLDVGFSSKERTCGLLFGEESPKCVTFAQAKAKIIQRAADASGFNLVIEAPLSVCFNDSGNPTPRKIEIEGGQSRRWYTGTACVVMVASTYLLRELWETKTSIRLFEGFVSYKDKSTKRSNHQQDVELLRAVVKAPLKFPHSIFEGECLKENPSDKLFSAFRVAGFDCEVPAVIKPNKLIAA